MYFSILTFMLLNVAFVFTLNPIIFVPGDGGSQIKARLNKSTSTAVYCEKHTQYYYTLWLDLSQISLAQNCFVDNMRLVYNTTTHQTLDSPGVSIQVPGFGNTDTVEFLDPGREQFTTYYYHIIERLTKEGYIRNLSLRGAPYDFRRSPNEFQDYFLKLKNLILETYKANNNSRVILIGHSMGSPTMLYFLNKQSQAWKDKYIRSLVTISGVWGGALKTLRLMASGDNLGIFVVKPHLVRKYQRSATSTAWLMPYDTFWKPDEVLVSQPKRNYTVNDYKQFFDDINYPIGYMMRKDTENLVKKLTPPGVEMFCIHGVNVSTPEKLVFTTGFPDEQPDVKNGPGDGTVNLRSLLGCLRWQKQQIQPVHHYTIPNQKHLEILKSKKLIDYIVEKVVGR